MWRRVMATRLIVPALALILLGGPGPVSETARVRLHLQGAETILGTRELDALTPDQRANRGEALTLLDGYRRAGRFPRNEDFPERMLPYFRDRHGTLCAMAYLLERTGYGHIVDHVARTRNNAYVPELVDEPGLADWLDRYGISVEEAARIQPQYGPPGHVDESNRLTAGYAVASGAGIGLAVTGAVLNLTAARGERRAAWLAAGAGLLTTVLGATNLEHRGDGRSVAVANLVIGGVATLVGIRGLFMPAADATTVADRARPLDVGLTVGPGGQPGLGARLRF